MDLIRPQLYYIDVWDYPADKVNSASKSMFIQITIQGFLQLPFIFHPGPLANLPQELKVLVVVNIGIMFHIWDWLC